jgi:hypothetical protein
MFQKQALSVVLRIFQLCRIKHLQTAKNLFLQSVVLKLTQSGRVVKRSELVRQAPSFWSLVDRCH